MYIPLTYSRAEAVLSSSVSKKCAEAVLFVFPSLWVHPVDSTKVFPPIKLHLPCSSCLSLQLYMKLFSGLVLLLCVIMVLVVEKTRGFSVSPTPIGQGRIAKLTEPISTISTSLSNNGPFIPEPAILQKRIEFQQLKKKIKQIKTHLPNALTILRVIAIPLVIMSFTLKKRSTAFVLYLLSCLTDLFDGYLARKWQITSEFGAFLDPVADKLMVATVLILLTSQYPSFVYILPVVATLVREIAVSALREFMAGQNIRDLVQVSQFGKVKTTLQMIASTLLLLVCPDKFSTDLDLCLYWKLSKPMVFVSGLITLYLSAAATVWSGYEYFKAAWPTLTGQGKNKFYDENNILQ